MSPIADPILQAVLKTVTLNSPMKDFRKAWYDFAIDDKAFFLVILAHAAADCDMSLRKGDPLEAVSYRMQAAQIVNARLGDPSSSLSDATIGTVAALATYEVSALEVLLR